MPKNMPKGRHGKVRVRRPASPRKEAMEQIVLPDIPADHRQLKWTIFHPSIIKVALASLLFALLSLGVLSGLFSKVNLIPCIIDNAGWGMCPINPSQLNVSTIYFGVFALDLLYPWIYALFLFIALPYLLSCMFVHYYNILFS
jgi:hypothetical protein